MSVVELEGVDEDVAGHAERYELQLMLYALAAGRHLAGATPPNDHASRPSRRPPSGASLLDGLDVAHGPRDAVLYFLRPGLTHVWPVTPEAVTAATARLAELGDSLIASRRAGRFARRESEACPSCPYHELCRHG